MTNWTEAGRKADATRVANLVRDRYSNPAKNAVRSWVVAELRASNPTLVLDLWGGGSSAEEMTAAGLSVLSVDRRVGFLEYGVSAARAERALRIKATESGYRAGWGSAARFAPECDAAWLDFMGHLAPVTIRTLKACRHMKLLVVTLMADRMKGAEDWTAETWIAMYRGAIEHYAGLKVWQTAKYPRDNGSWILVFLARRADGREHLRTSARLRAVTDPAWAERRRAANQARSKANYADPVKRAAILARQRARWADPEYRARQKSNEAERMTDPDYRARRLAALRERTNRPDYRERKRTATLLKYATDPEYRAQLADRQRELWKDPEFRRRANERQRAYKARKKAERQAEAG